MNRLLYLLSTIIILFAATACSNNSDPVDQPPSTTERTVLVYMVANNSLGTGGYDRDDIDEMCQAARSGAFGHSRLIVYHAPRNADPMLLEITGSGETVVLKNYSTTPLSVTSERMREAIADTKEIAPADKYGLILWSHGTGWIENGIKDEINTLSFGDDLGRHMNVTTLALTLEGAGFDYIYFDCCYMSGIEVAYELRRCARHIIASATELPLPGMPYHLTLPYLMRGEPDLPSAAAATFNYYDKLSGSDRTCTISVIRTEGLERLADATKAIYAANNILPPGTSIQRYMTSTCYLFDFRQYVEALSTDKKLLDEWTKAFEDVVIYKNQTPMLWNYISLDHHSGLSTYIGYDAASMTYRGYNRLQWYSDVASSLGF